METDRLYRNIKDWVTIDELGIEVHFVKEAAVLSDDSHSSEKFMHGHQGPDGEDLYRQARRGRSRIRFTKSQIPKSSNNRSMGNQPFGNLFAAQRDSGSTFAARAAGQ